MGGMRQGGRIAAPIFKQWAQTALKDQPKVPFVAPAGIRWVRIDRATGKRVFGTFPTKEDPEIVGDLGSVPAANRAAPFLPPPQGDAVKAKQDRCSSQQRPGRKARAGRGPWFAQPRGRRASARARSRTACKRRTRSIRPAPESISKVLINARRSASPYRPDQCRDGASAPVPRLGPGDEAARRAQCQGRGSVAVGRPQGGAGRDARAPPARRGDRRHARDRARAGGHGRADRAGRGRGRRGLVDDGVASLADLADRAERDKVAALLAGEADANNAYVEVNAGAGGTESQDWAGCSSGCTRAGASATG